jgi:hypothetical protein
MTSSQVKSSRSCSLMELNISLTSSTLYSSSVISLINGKLLKLSSF